MAASETAEEIEVRLDVELRREWVAVIKSRELVSDIVSTRPRSLGPCGAIACVAGMKGTMKTSAKAG